MERLTRGLPPDKGGVEAASLPRPARVFSFEKMVHSDRRNQMGPDLLNALITINWNYPLIKLAQEVSSSYDFGVAEVEYETD